MLSGHLIELYISPKNKGKKDEIFLKIWATKPSHSKVSFLFKPPIPNRWFFVCCLTVHCPICLFACMSRNSTAAYSRGLSTQSRLYPIYLTVKCELSLFLSQKQCNERWNFYKIWGTYRVYMVRSVLERCFAPSLHAWPHLTFER